MRARSITPISCFLGLGMVALTACSSDTTAPIAEALDTPPIFGWGNGAPNGEHYNLNIIGVPKNKSADMTGNSGHRIFVPLGSDGNPSKTTIRLCESGVGGECVTLDPSTFRVLDANGTDGEAKFALPDPDPDADGRSVYSVYARPLGKPGGKASNTTCGEVEELDPVTGEPTGEYITICSMVQLRLDRTKGKQSFINATSCLLYIYADLPYDDVDGIVRTPIFGDPLVDSWWEWSNEGLKLAQLRFYPMPSDVPTPDEVVDCTSKGKPNR